MFLFGKGWNAEYRVAGLEACYSRIYANHLAIVQSLVAHLRLQGLSSLFLQFVGLLAFHTTSCWPTVD